MQIAFTVLALLGFGIWSWQFGGAMVRAREWSSLITTHLLTGIALYYAVVHIWDISPWFPSQAFEELIMPLIEIVYGPWL